MAHVIQVPSGPDDSFLVLLLVQVIRAVQSNCLWGTLARVAGPLKAARQRSRLICMIGGCHGVVAVVDTVDDDTRSA